MREYSAYSKDPEKMTYYDQTKPLAKFTRLEGIDQVRRDVIRKVMIPNRLHVAYIAYWTGNAFGDRILGRITKKGDTYYYENARRVRIGAGQFNDPLYIIDPVTGKVKRTEDWMRM